MFRSLLDFYNYLPQEKKKEFKLYQILMSVTSLIEFFAIGSLVPYLNYALKGNDFIIDSILDFIRDNFTISNSIPDIYVISAFILLFLLFSTILSLLTVWKITHFSTGLSAFVSSGLFEIYMKMDFEFFVENNTSALTKNIISETDRVLNSILIPFILLNSKLILTIVFIIMLVLFKPIESIIVFSFFMVVYFIVFSMLKSKLHLNGDVISAEISNRYSILNTAFGGILTIIISDKQNFFIEKFRSSSFLLSEKQGDNLSFNQAPKFIVEFVTFFLVIISVVLYSFFKSNNDELLTTFIVFGIVALKLLPAFQQIYGSLSSIKGSIQSLKNVTDGLKLIIKSNDNDFSDNVNRDRNGNEIRYKKRNQYKKTYEISLFKSDIRLVSLQYTHPGSNHPFIKNFNLVFNKNSSIAFVGPSGSGKSTIVNLMIGLLKPSYGEIYIDDILTDKYLFRTLRNKIGYVPQNVFLMDCSISENIAFGLDFVDIDFDRVRLCLQMVDMLDLFNNKKDGLQTVVGERGIQLSGGQVQRIGIARALYNEPEILILDEATSALDSPTESAIMSSIDNLKDSISIIVIAHRINTIKNVDRIYVLNNGTVVNDGTFDYLLNNCDLFKKLNDVSD